MVKKENKTDFSNLKVIDKLKSLYQLQLIDSEIDRIKTLRGELPLEVRDLEDEVAGLSTRISNVDVEIKNLKEQIKSKEHIKVESQSLIEKYTEQRNNVRNNREYDSLNKEIEFQTLEIELCEKKIKEFKQDIDFKTSTIQDSKDKLDEKSKNLEQKKSELENIIEETKIDEEKLIKEAELVAENIEPRLLYAYNRTRNNLLNKVAIAPVERGACGGCFNRIPPQRQLDIKSCRKIIPCEYCGRILVDADSLEL